MRRIYYFLVLVTIVGLSGCAKPMKVSSMIGQETKADKEPGRTDQTDKDVSQRSETRKAHKLARQGDKYYEAGNYEKALEHYREALSLDSQTSMALAGLGLIHYRKQEYAESIDAYERALAVKQNTEWSQMLEKVRDEACRDRLAAAKVAHQEGEYRKADALFEEALFYKEDAWWLHREWGISCFEREKWEAAEKQFRWVLELQPNQETTYEWLVKVHLRQHNPGKARDVVKAYRERFGQTSEYERMETLLQDKQQQLVSTPEIAAVLNKPAINRGDLAGLMRQVLDIEQLSAPNTAGRVLLDVQDHWASKAIRTTVHYGLMNVYPNHTFRPNKLIHRGDMARTVVNALRRFNILNDKSVMTEQPVIDDVFPENLYFEDIAWALSFEIMHLKQGNAFNLTDKVSGKEAIETLERLQEVIERYRR